MTKEISGNLNAAGLRFGIVVSRFNSFITDQLLKGAIDVFLRHGCKENDLTIYHVPGSFELGVTAKKIAKSGNISAIVTLGAVIRGDTSHYDLVCNSAVSAISQVGLETGIPTIFGVITTENMEQAIDRSGGKAGNKGAEAALTAIEMANLLKAIE